MEEMAAGATAGESVLGVIAVSRGLVVSRGWLGEALAVPLRTGLIFG